MITDVSQITHEMQEQLVNDIVEGMDIDTLMYMVSEYSHSAFRDDPESLIDAYNDQYFATEEV